MLHTPSHTNPYFQDTERPWNYFWAESDLNLLSAQKQCPSYEATEIKQLQILTVHLVIVVMMKMVSKLSKAQIIPYLIGGFLIPLSENYPLYYQYKMA